ncbi:MAG: (Fe-S)-binding protein, partial [Woeseiaceae bacterium]
MKTFQTSSAHILELADRCVKCGLCLPQCPTYNLNSNENESPRGRIALVQGWLGGDLSPSKILVQHLDQCLLCRRCERVCPSQVPYAEIMDESRALLLQEASHRHSLKQKITNYSLKLLIHKKFSVILFNFLRLLQKTRILSFAKKIGVFSLFGITRLTSYLPELKKPFKAKPFYPALIDSNKSVILFTGCMSKQLEPSTIISSIKLLNRLGYGVHIPEQTCCGALHLHEGNKAGASELANSNIKSFNAYENIDAIISLVNGCSAQLKEYEQLEIDTPFNTETKDIIEFLSEVEWPTDISFKPFNKKASLQIPCSLQNTLRAEDKLLKLVQRIPGLSIDTSYNECCGAAGSYFLKQPQLSDQLKQRAFKHLTKANPDYIISSNLGCALQLQSSLSTEKSS